MKLIIKYINEYFNFILIYHEKTSVILNKVCNGLEYVFIQQKTIIIGWTLKYCHYCRTFRGSHTKFINVMFVAVRHYFLYKVIHRDLC